MAAIGIGPTQPVPDPYTAAEAALPGTPPAPPAPPEAIPGRPAAVLVPIFPAAGAAPGAAGRSPGQEAHVLLTRRSTRLRSHTGQVSFPGGRIDEGESAVAAALRESAEEVGLDPGAVEILGQLAPLSTLSGASFITPFVGLLARRPVLRPNPAEVELAFDVALSHLAAPHVYGAERWVMADGIEHPMHLFALGEDVVWGATARILHQLLELVHHEWTGSLR